MCRVWPQFPRSQRYCEASRNDAEHSAGFIPNTIDRRTCLELLQPASVEHGALKWRGHAPKPAPAENDCARCSPTRAALLTGRNHQRVGNGTIAERAVDWDGYTGVIPKSSATMAEVMRHYGYKTAAIGKWHNTPADQTTSMGPFDRWPTGHGFDYFYGFLAGETSQWEPRLVENTNQIEPPHSEKYHLSEDLAQRGIDWLRRHRAFAPDKPFLLYWAPGAGHGPHQIFKEWADKYKGKFDNGWDEYRERVFARQKQLGWIPADTKLTSRAASMPSWDSIPEAQRPFQRRLMEIFAGFVEHVDVQAGRMVDELERLGIRDNTIVIYIFGDNGASAEGQNGTISELLAQNGIPNTVDQQLAALDKIGGLDALGSSKTDSMYHAGWAWAGNTPFQHTKLVASHFGGTRNPMVISWPKGIKPDKTPRSQFHHVNDIAPTIYEIVGIKPPKVVDGVTQDPIDGVSLAYTFSDPKTPTRKKQQYFDNNGSRAMYQDGWIAATFGPLVPWLPGAPGLAQWDLAKDKWELYLLSEDFSEANDLATKEPRRLVQLQKTFDEQARANKVYPLGAGIWLRLHPEARGEDGRLVQPLPLHGHVLAHARRHCCRGRNHTRVGNGQIAEFANDWEGFSGTIPKSAATVGRGAEVLRVQHRARGASGTTRRPSRPPPRGRSTTGRSGYGFEYFYGFLAGEASQYEPHMVRNTVPVNPHELHRKGYHLTEDIAEDAIRWLREQQAFAPDKPFLMYWAPGASHGPHHVTKEWADKYKGKFDDGWDKYRERAFARQKQLGWIPQNAKLTPRPDTLPSWESIPEAEKPFQRRLMEVFAGFTEHADYNAGRVIDEIEKQGRLDNTLIFYIWGDNGSSAEGQNGSISELIAQNGIPSTVEQHIKALDDLGGLAVLGSPKTDNMYHAGWAWAGSTPYKSTKVVAAHFGGTRQPMAVAWPRGIKPDADPAAAVPPRHRHRADDLRGDEDHPAAGGQRRPAGLDRRRQHGLHVRRREGQGPADDAVLRHHGQSGRLPRRLVRLHLRPAQPLDAGVAEGNPGVVAREGHLGAVQPGRGLEPGRRPRRQDAREARRDEGPVPGRIGEEQEPADRRRAVDAGAFHPEDGARDPLHRVDVPRPGHPDARVHRPEARQVQQHRQHGRGRAREGQRRAVRPRRLLRRADLLRPGRGPLLRVQPVRTPADPDQGQGQVAGRQGDDRGRIQTGGGQAGVPDGRHPQGRRQGRGPRPGAGDRPRSRSPRTTASTSAATSVPRCRQVIESSYRPIPCCYQAILSGNQPTIWLQQMPYRVPISSYRNGI